MKITTVADISESPVSDPEAKNVSMRMLIGPENGAKNFFLRRFRVSPGGYTPLHKHAWEHEVFVLSGQGKVVSGQGARRIVSGSIVFVAPQEMHQFKNTGDADLEFLCIVPASSAG